MRDEIVKNERYVHALKYSWLTRFYDPVVALTIREKVFRKKLLEQASMHEQSQVLDLACGTGTFAVLIKQRFPGAQVNGLDGDPEILALAQKKSKDACVDVVFDQGMSFSMPYRADRFDVVFSSLFFHHLRTEQKLQTMKEVMRVLKPGGVFHVCDWGHPSNLYSKIMFNAIRLLDGFEVTRDNVRGQLRMLMESAAFADCKNMGRVETSLGTLDLISAVKPLD